jgi:hypothetical protein
MGLFEDFLILRSNGSSGDGDLLKTNGLLVLEVDLFFLGGVSCNLPWRPSGITGLSELLLEEGLAGL